MNGQLLPQPQPPRESGDWPAAPDGFNADTYKEKLIDAQLKAHAERLAAEAKGGIDRQAAQEKVDADQIVALDKLYREADLENLGKYYDKIATLAVGSIDRTRAAADVVQKASAAIATIYTGVLALVFSVSDNPLPARGVLAPIFLGAAVVLSTAYLAYVREPEKIQDFWPSPRPSSVARAYEQLRQIVRTSSRIALRRTETLRRSVVALGVGLAAIALPFITFSTTVPSTATPTAWPSAPNTGNAALDRILYTAQVAETAQKRATESKGSVVDRWDKPILFIGLVIGVGLILVVPWQQKRGDAGNGDGSNTAVALLTLAGRR